MRIEHGPRRMSMTDRSAYLRQETIHRPAGWEWSIRLVCLSVAGLP